MEELKHLLSCASLALERVAANAEMQRQIQEARLRDLQELLIATRRERDEAREQLLKLENNPAEYSMRTITQQHVMPSDQSQWPDRELLASGDLVVNNSSSHPAWLINHSQESEQLQEIFESRYLTSPPSILGWAPAAMPEPPEADLEVSERALPEKGKLLQAVMQARPLLQTLLSKGPLPKWNQPPLALDSVDIPRTSMCSSNNCLIPIAPMVHPVPTPHGPADTLPVNSAVSFSHGSLSRRTRINKAHRTAFASYKPQRWGSKPAPSSSKSLFAPVLNSLDSTLS